MKLSCYLTVGIILMAAVPANGQGNRPSNRPVEYIESTSPLPGGGVVSSVVIPGREGPTYDLRTPSSVPVREASMRQSNGLQSVLTPGQVQQPSYPSAGSVTATGQPAYPQSVGNHYRVAGQWPSLGVPTAWNRSLRPAPVLGCPVPTRSATLSPPPAVYPPAASTRPTLNSTGTAPQLSVVAPRTSTYTPLIRLQNLPPNAYAGQGIIGSPKLYVDGQPIRNLLRYLIIP